MNSKNNKTFLTCSIILVSMEVFCLMRLCFSRCGILVLLMALLLLYMHMYARTEEEAILFLRQKGFWQEPNPIVQPAIELQHFEKEKCHSDKGFWLCPTHKSFTVPLRRGSFFDRQSLPLRNIVELLLLWPFKEPVLNMTGLTGVGENTVIQWFLYVSGTSVRGGF